MIDFQRLDLDNKARYDAILRNCGQRGCEYSFVNLFLWGRQKAAFLGNRLAVLSQYDRKCVYPFPVGEGDLKKTIDTLIRDAQARGIPCYLTSLSPEDCKTVESLYPGRFTFHEDRDVWDYVYNINDLADLKGRKFQKKRNHLNRFEEAHPNCQYLPLDESTRVAAFQMLGQWYRDRAKIDTEHDFHLEQLALQRAFAFQKDLEMEGLVLVEGGKVLAFAMGSRLNETTFDIHFEKALEEVDGAYPAINRGFARYLRDKYPELLYLDREDDLGLEGLRKAKLSYNPAFMVEKYWARLWEAEDDHF